MAIKYKREGFRDRAEELRHHEPLGPPRLPINTKRKFSIIYLAISAFALLLLVYSVSQGPLSFRGQPVESATAVVESKAVETPAFEGEQYVLNLTFTDLDGKSVRSTFVADATTWERYQEGDHVAIHYQVNRNGRAVRVLDVEPAETPDGTPEPY